MATNSIKKTYSLFNLLLVLPFTFYVLFSTAINIIHTLASESVVMILQCSYLTPIFCQHGIHKQDV